MVDPVPIRQEAADFDTFWRMFKGLDRASKKAWCRFAFDQIVSPNGFDTLMEGPNGKRIPVNWKATPEAICAGAKAYRNKMWDSNTETRYIRTAAVWLNQGGWEDEE